VQRLRWTHVVVIAWLVATVATTALLRAFVYPLSDQQTLDGPGPWTTEAWSYTLAGLGLLALLVGVYAKRSTLSRVLGLALLLAVGPIVAAVLASRHAAEHDTQDHMFSVYRRYTTPIHRTFERPWIYVRSGPVGDVCAVEQRARVDDYLCLSMDLRRGPGREVEGGYRATIKQVTSRPGVQFACFGRDRQQGECAR
jgi:hypothetical protein